MTILLILARSLHIGGMLLAFGILLFSRFYLPSFDAEDAEKEAGLLPLRRQLFLWVGMTLLVVMVSGGLWLGLVTVQMSDVVSWTAVTESDLLSVLEETQFGHLWLIRGALLVVLLEISFLTIVQKRPVAEPLALLLAALLTGSLAWAGHGASSGHSAHLLADVGHLLVAAVWPMGLIPLVLFLRLASALPGDLVVNVLEKFSRNSLIAVGLILLTGVINSCFLIGSIGGLFETVYGCVLLLKLLLFVGMVVLGNRHRVRVGQLAARHDPAADVSRKLFRSVLVESLLACAVVGLVGVLGSIAPAR